MSDVGYRAGDWFVIPLPDGRFAPARVVLHRLPHNVLAYVFEPQTRMPTLDGVARLDPGDAVAAQHISGLLIGEAWPLLGGGADGFARTGWKIPEFEVDLRHAFPPGKEVRVAFIDDQLRTVHSFQAPLSELGKRQQDGVFGAEGFRQWFAARAAAGDLAALRTQPWWEHPTRVPDTAVAHARPATDKLDAVTVVVPGRGRAVSDIVEMTLMLELDPATGELDGTMRSPTHTHVVVYGPDGLKLADRVVELLRPLSTPAGTHLLVCAGNDEWTMSL